MLCCCAAPRLETRAQYTRLEIESRLWQSCRSNDRTLNRSQVATTHILAINDSPTPTLTLRHHPLPHSATPRPISCPPLRLATLSGQTAAAAGRRPNQRRAVAARRMKPRGAPYGRRARPWRPWRRGRIPRPVRGSSIVDDRATASDRPISPEPASSLTPRPPTTTLPAPPSPAPASSAPRIADALGPERPNAPGPAPRATRPRPYPRAPLTGFRAVPATQFTRR